MAALCGASAPPERLETHWHVGCWAINKATEGHLCKGAGRVDGIRGGLGGGHSESGPECAGRANRCLIVHILERLPEVNRSLGLDSRREITFPKMKTFTVDFDFDVHF